MPITGGVFFAYCLNNPLIYIDPTGQKSWLGKFTSWVKKGWDEIWDAGNQFARWADQNGLHSGNIGITSSSTGDFAFQGMLNEQQLDWNGKLARINRGVLSANNSVATQLANINRPTYNYRPLNRARIPMVGCGPLQCNGIIGGNNNSTFHWSDNLNLGRVVWNHPVTRTVIPDFISVGFGFSGVFGTGGATSIDLQWITRGNDASFFPALTATQAIGVGYSIDATFNIGGAYYLGSVKDIKRGMLTTSIQDGDGSGWVSFGATEGGKVGITGSYTPTRTGHGIIGYSIDVGVGLPAGLVPINGAAGVSNTWVIYDFK